MRMDRISVAPAPSWCVEQSDVPKPFLTSLNVYLRQLKQCSTETYKPIPNECTIVVRGTIRGTVICGQCESRAGCHPNHLHCPYPYTLTTTLSVNLPLHCKALRHTLCQIVQGERTASDTRQCDEYNDRFEPVIGEAIAQIVPPDLVLRPTSLAH